MPEDIDYPGVVAQLQRENEALRIALRMFEMDVRTPHFWEQINMPKLLSSKIVWLLILDALALSAMVAIFYVDRRGK